MSIISPHCSELLHQFSLSKCIWTWLECQILLNLPHEATNEMEFGIDNPWNRVISNGRCSYPDFGQHVPITYFKAFCSAYAYAWADKKFWYIDKRDQTWVFFISFSHTMIKEVSYLDQSYSCLMSKCRHAVLKLQNLAAYQTHHMILTNLSH